MVDKTWRMRRVNRANWGGQASVVERAQVQEIREARQPPWPDLTSRPFHPSFLPPRTPHCLLTALQRCGLFCLPSGLLPVAHCLPLRSLFTCQWGPPSSPSLFSTLPVVFRFWTLDYKFREGRHLSLVPCWTSQQTSGCPLLVSSICWMNEFVNEWMKWIDWRTERPVRSTESNGEASWIVQAKVNHCF